MTDRDKAIEEYIRKNFTLVDSRDSARNMGIHFGAQYAFAQSDEQIKELVGALEDISDLVLGGLDFTSDKKLTRMGALRAILKALSVLEKHRGAK